MSIKAPGHLHLRLDTDRVRCASTAWLNLLFLATLKLNNIVCAYDCNVLSLLFSPTHHQLANPFLETDYISA